jgi:hypothetical protein
VYKAAGLHGVEEDVVEVWATRNVENVVIDISAEAAKSPPAMIVNLAGTKEKEPQTPQEPQETQVDFHWDALEASELEHIPETPQQADTLAPLPTSEMSVSEVEYIPVTPQEDFSSDALEASEMEPIPETPQVDTLAPSLPASGMSVSEMEHFPETPQVDTLAPLLPTEKENPNDIFCTPDIAEAVKDLPAKAVEDLPAKATVKMEALVFPETQIQLDEGVTLTSLLKKQAPPGKKSPGKKEMKRRRPPIFLLADSDYRDLDSDSGTGFTI